MSKLLKLRDQKQPIFKSWNVIVANIIRQVKGDR